MFRRLTLLCTSLWFYVLANNFLGTYIQDDIDDVKVVMVIGSRLTATCLGCDKTGCFDK